MGTKGVGTGKTGIRYITVDGKLAGKDGLNITSKVGGGLARIANQPVLTPIQVQQALSGYICRTLRLDKEQLAALKLLGELYGLWGPGRKLPKADDTEAQPAPFSMETDKAQE